LKNNIIDIVSNGFNAKNKWGLVIGDIMLDKYISGVAKRISPEAPVPIINVNENFNKIGGAGNVALNLLSLGIKTVLIGEIGSDNSGEILKDLFRDNGIATKNLIKKRGLTTTKTRIMSGQQQMVRLDYDELSTGPNQTELKKILKLISTGPNAIIISDYEKGFLTPTFLKQVIQSANKKNIPVLIDPKGTVLEKYRGATAITPNKKEALILANLTNNDDQLLNAALKKIIKEYSFNFIAMTQGDLGIKHITKNKVEDYPSTTSKEVFDVSGAGDTVIATLAASLIANTSLEDAFRLANFSAGIVIRKIGTMPILRHELLKELQYNSITEHNIGKAIHKKDLLEFVEILRESYLEDPELKDIRIGFTNGCFDILHAGHVTYLEKAKKQVDFLILALNSDTSVRKIKGPKRPVVGEIDRARVLCALESVDVVVLFDEPSPLNLIKSIKPNILFKGNDYAIKNVVGAKEMKQWGGKVTLIPVVQGKSTTKIINKLN
jgi:D-beta-D-heptose 7-phosphate kinase / D-beta-D-heptose 1-phosphate adenosyltransferase